MKHSLRKCNLKDTTIILVQASFQQRLEQDFLHLCINNTFDFFYEHGAVSMSTIA